MSLLNMLTEQLGGDQISTLSKQLGVNESQASSAIAAALPMIVGALARNSSTPDGAASLRNALEKDHDGSILDNLGGFLGSSDNGAGAGILKHVFGGSLGNVVGALGQSSGLGNAQAGSLLENLAPIVMGQLGRQTRTRGLDTGGLASMLGGEASSINSGTGAAALSMLNSFLDKDGDGSAIDDIGGMLGNFFKR
jgi:hypothetical protein